MRLTETQWIQRGEAKFREVVRLFDGCCCFTTGFFDDQNSTSDTTRRHGTKTVGTLKVGVPQGNGLSRKASPENSCDERI